MLATRPPGSPRPVGASSGASPPTPLRPTRWTSPCATPACWRATVRLVRHGEPAPGLLSEAVLYLARAVEDLAGYLEQPTRTVELPSETVASRFALNAAEEATAVLHERSDLPTSVLVGQVRSTAVDLLWASGMHLDEAAGELDGAVRNAS